MTANIEGAILTIAKLINQAQNLDMCKIAAPQFDSNSSSSDRLNNFADRCARG